MKIPHYFDKHEDISVHQARFIHGAPIYRGGLTVVGAICASIGYTYVAGRARVRHAARKSEDGEEHYKVRRNDFE